MSKPEAINIRLSPNDKAAFQAVAKDCGYEENLSAFVRAIARGDISVSHSSQRIDKIRARVEALEQQQRRDYESIMQHIQSLSNCKAS